MVKRSLSTPRSSRRGPNPCRSGARLREAISAEGFRAEFLGELAGHLRDRISPDLWQLSWPLVDDERREHLTTLLADQPSTLDWFPREQAYPREHRPPP